MTSWWPESTTIVVDCALAVPDATVRTIDSLVFADGATRLGCPLSTAGRFEATGRTIASSCVQRLKGARSCPRSLSIMSPRIATSVGAMSALLI